MAPLFISSLRHPDTCAADPHGIWYSPDRHDNRPAFGHMLGMLAVRLFLSFLASFTKYMVYPICATPLRSHNPPLSLNPPSPGAFSPWGLVNLVVGSTLAIAELALEEVDLPSYISRVRFLGECFSPATEIFSQLQGWGAILGGKTLVWKNFV